MWTTSNWTLDHSSWHVSEMSQCWLKIAVNRLTTPEGALTMVRRCGSTAKWCLGKERGRSSQPSANLSVAFNTEWGSSVCTVPGECLLPVSARVQDGMEECYGVLQWYQDVPAERLKIEHQSKHCTVHNHGNIFPLTSDSSLMELLWSGTKVGQMVICGSGVTGRNYAAYKFLEVLNEP